jgi:histone deacetylase complex subunit SAP18
MLFNVKIHVSSYVNEVFLHRMDATLREITSLVKEVNPEARRKGTYFDFSLVFPDMRSPGYRMREIGTTCSGQRGADDSKTLAQAR